LREAQARRPTPKSPETERLFFVTKFGTGWDKSGNGKNHANPVGAEAKKLLLRLRVYRPGLGFYTLRHTFRTIGDEVRDQIAIDHIMGHARDDMASHYRESIGDERLRAIVNHVRGWLYNQAT
jgi:integrase